VDPAKLDAAALLTIPVTVKADLIRQPDDFLCADTERHLATRTTGTTGRPAEIWLSRYEMELWPALGALATILQNDMRATDVMQVNISSRATVSIALDVAGCRLVGAGCRVLGIVPHDEALDKPDRRQRDDPVDERELPSPSWSSRPGGAASARPTSPCAASWPAASACPRAWPAPRARRSAWRPSRTRSA